MFNWFSTKDKDGKELNLGYALDGEPKTIEDIKKLFSAFQLSTYFDQIKPHIRPKIDLKLTPIEESKLVDVKSKIGGQPHMKIGHPWPRNENGKSLSFIGQINFEEVSKFDKSGLLPRHGLVSFFYCADQEAWGFDPKDKQRFKVYYSEQNCELVKHDFPVDLEHHSIFKPCSLTFSASLSLPTLEHDLIENLIPEHDYENYIEACSGPDNQILGYANCVQGNMELECQLVSNGLYCGNETGYEDPKRKELEEGKMEWVLLFQVGSEEDKAGMMWGDCGRIYFWIKKQDLLNKDFNNTWCILQCH